MSCINLENQEGFIALISAIIIGAMLIVITFAVSSSGFFARANVLDSELKKISLGLANACAQQAMLDLAGNTTLTFPKAVTVGAQSCKICNVIVGTPNIIQVRAVYHGAYTNLNASLAKDVYGNFTINSWLEVSVNPNPSCLVP